MLTSAVESMICVLAASKLDYHALERKWGAEVSKPHVPATTGQRLLSSAAAAANLKTITV